MAFGSAETAKLVVDLSLTGNFQSQLGKVNRALNQTGAKLNDTSTRAYRAGQQIGTGIKRGLVLAVGAIGTLTAALAFSVKEGQDAADKQKLFAAAIQNSYASAADQTKTLTARIKTFQRALDNAKPGSKAAQNLTNELKQLKGQLANIGAVTPVYVAALNAQQKALLNLTGVDDDLIKSEQTRLIQMGLSGKATLALTPLILGAARATGKDLLTVTVAAGKAANGNATALQRLGIIVDKTRFQVDPLAETIRVLSQRFGNVNQALSGSLDTRLNALRENLRNIAEDVGIQLLPGLTKIVDVVGTKLVPALGKFVDRILPDITKGLDEFAAALENGGAENAINGISDAVSTLVGWLKVAAGPVKVITQAFLSLPSQIQGVLIGAVAVNKLTGGLVTNVAGGIVGSIVGGLSRIIGKNVVQPVFVTNQIPGIGGGGVPGVATKAAGLSLFGVGAAAALGLAIAAAWKANVQDPQLQGQTDAIDKSVIQQRIGNASLEDLKKSEAALQQGIAQLTVTDKNGNPVPILNDIAGLLYGGQKDDLKKNLAIIQAAIAAWEKAHFQPGPGTNVFPAGKGKKRNEKGADTQPTIEALRGKIGEHLSRAEIKQGVKDANLASKQDIENLRGKISDGLRTNSKDIETLRGQIASGLQPNVQSVGGDVEAARGGIIAAIDSKDLSIKQNIDIKVNVSAAGVTKSVTIQNRYGPGNGSAGRDLGGPNGAGGMVHD